MLKGNTQKEKASDKVLHIKQLFRGVDEKVSKMQCDVKTLIQKDICTIMAIAALYTTATT